MTLLLDHPQFTHAVHVLENLRDQLGDTAVHLAARGVLGVPTPPPPAILDLGLPSTRKSDAEAALLALMTACVHLQETGDASWITSAFELGVEFLEQYAPATMAEALTADNSPVVAPEAPIEDAS